jgi:glycosyltransferase involved in cell wall biosynthesis
MKFYIVIPAHNEEDSIGLTLDSLVMQSHLPKSVVVVNDNSTDDTEQIIEAFATKYSWITLVNSNSSDEHLPGTKIINAFYKGFDTLDDDYDVICKYDADLIFPINYLENLTNLFKGDKKLGMAAGLCYIRKNKEWVFEDLTSKKHIRGALKAFRKECFLEIGKLKQSMGWDTVDELLALYYGWTFKTDDTLKVKHLKPTGLNYGKASKHLQGEALYKMRYGFILSFLSALKLAYKKKSVTLFKEYNIGYLKASKDKADFIITEDQGKFIRENSWKNIRKKFFQLK